MQLRAPAFFTRQCQLATRRGNNLLCESDILPLVVGDGDSFLQLLTSSRVAENSAGAGEGGLSATSEGGLSGIYSCVQWGTVNQGDRTIRNEIGNAASTTEIPFSSTAISTRSFRRVKPIKSRVTRAIYLARKSENQARKEIAKEKNRAKRLEPQRERVSKFFW